MDIFYKPENIFLVQAENRFDLIEVTDLEASTPIEGAPEFFRENVLIFEGHPDPIDPVTIFFRQREILLSGEYWIE